MNAEDGTDLGFVGRIVKTNSKLIDAMLSAGVMPAVACLAMGDTDKEYYNVNGDQMAASVAGGCQAETLVFVTDVVGGVLDGEGKQIAELNRTGINELMTSGIAAGGMRPKLRACLEGLEAGVKRILIVGAAEENVLTRVLQHGEQLGTTINQ